MIDNFKLIFERIRQHYVHACEKHPKFCDKLIPEWSPHNFINWEQLAEDAKNRIKFYDHIKECDSAHILKAEVREVYAAYAKGDYEGAEYEIYDSIAVLLRMLDMIRATKEEKEEANAN